MGKTVAADVQRLRIRAARGALSEAEAEDARRCYCETQGIPSAAAKFVETGGCRRRLPGAGTGLLVR